MRFIGKPLQITAIIDIHCHLCVILEGVVFYLFGEFESEILLIHIGLVEGLSFHKCDGGSRQGVIFIIQNRSMIFDDGRIIGEELVQVERDVQQKQQNENYWTDQRSFGADWLILGYWDEWKEVHFS